MKTWNDYKDHVGTVDPEAAKVIKEAEEIAAIVSAKVGQTNLTQPETTKQKDGNDKSRTEQCQPYAESIEPMISTHNRVI